MKTNEKPNEFYTTNVKILQHKTRHDLVLVIDIDKNRILDQKPLAYINKIGLQFNVPYYVTLKCTLKPNGYWSYTFTRHIHTYAGHKPAHNAIAPPSTGQAQPPHWLS